MNKLRQLLLFLNRGASQRLVEREVGINRRTIISYLNRINQAGLSFKALLEFDDHKIEQVLGLKPAAITETDPRRTCLKNYRNSAQLF